MKKAAIFVLALVLLLSAGGLTRPALADCEECDSRDAYFNNPDNWDFNPHTEGRGDDDDTADDAVAPERTPRPDSVYKHDYERGELDQSAVPEDIAEGTIGVYPTTVGTIVVHGTGRVFWLRGGEVFQTYDCDNLSEDNRVFDAYDFFEDPEYRWWGYIDEKLVYFTEREMIEEYPYIAEIGIDEKGFYCYQLVDGGLAAISLQSGILGLRVGVRQVHTVAGHTFFEDIEGDIYVINASPYDLCNGEADTFDFILLGNSSEHGVDYYCMQLDAESTGKTPEQAIKDFDGKYGVTFND